MPFNPAAIEQYRPSQDKEVINEKRFVDAKKADIIGDYSQAEALFKQVVEENPQNDAAYYELANMYYRKNNIEDALLFASEAARLDPGNKWYQLLLAELYQKNKQFDKAAEVFERMIEIDPENIEYRFNLAASLIFDEEYADAIEQYDLIEEKIGVTEEISIQKKKLYIHLGKIDKAAAELEKLIEAYPLESRHYAMLAEFYNANNRPEDAYRVYRIISEKFPDDPYIHISLADYYRSRGENEKSFEQLKKGFANPNLDIDTKIQILLSYYTVTEIYEDLKEEAMALGEILVEAHPDDPKSHSMYADFLVRDERFEEARDQFLKVLELDDSKFLIWEGLLRVYAELEDYSAMSETGTRALELFPEQPVLYLFKGVALFQLGKYDECIDIFERGTKFIVENDPLLAQFYMYIGDAHHRLKNIAASDEAYDKVLVIDPSNSYVLNNYAYYLSLRGEKLDKAEIMAKKATQLDPANSANLDTYGWVLYRLGKYEEAEKWLKKALENGGSSNAVILEHYGDTMYQLGNIEKALQYWRQAREAGEGSEFLDRKVMDGKLYE